jgi:hypothetical protein
VLHHVLDRHAQGGEEDAPGQVMEVRHLPQQTG